MRTVIRNGAVLDTHTMEYSTGDVVVENGTIVDTGTTGATGDLVVDAGGQFVVPGLMDAHVHFRLSTMNFRALEAWSEVEFGIAMARLARGTLERGFTTVRDLGGEVTGLINAIAAGTADGPRILRAGRMISQTGGHGDTAGGHLEMPSCACALRSNSFSVVADGPDAVRKAARHLLRDGSDFLKIHVSGGVASPMDPLDSIQFTPEEVTAAVTEAAHRHTYVAAHAYSPESIAMAVENGVHSVEHANLIDDETAAKVARAGAVVVPTLVTYKAMNDQGPALGLPAKNMEKNRVIFESGLRSLEILTRAGVTLGFGTDLIGEQQALQNDELRIRSEVQPVRDVLRSMWLVNADLMGLKGLVGEISPGAFGDLVVSRVDPLEDMSGFADPSRSVSMVLLGGIPRVDRTS